MDVQQSAPDKLRAGSNSVMEVSLVRKGAREACYVTANEADGQTKFTRSGKMQEDTASAWACFNLE